jgi:hypothetical protein
MPGQTFIGTGRRRVTGRSQLDWQPRMTGKTGRRRRRSGDPLGRRLRLESLELRQLLSVMGYVTGNGITIPDLPTVDTNQQSDGTNFGNATAGLTSVTETFTIQNNGTLTYNLTGSPLVQLTDTTDFSVVASPNSSVVPGGSTTFQIRFSPSTTGPLTATLSIPDNDAHMSGNAYEFDIQGTGIAPAPTINVQGNGLTIPTDLPVPAPPAPPLQSPLAADGTDFGLATVASGTVTHTFTIRNTGTATLDLTGSPLVQVSNAANFSVITGPNEVIPVGASTTFQVEFHPVTGGTDSATVTIDTNDPNSNDDPYTITIQGTGDGPEINLEGGSKPIAEGSTTPSTLNDTDFGGVPVATGVKTETFTIENVGTTALSLTGSPLVTLGDNTNFSVLLTPSSSVAGGGMTTFEVEFMPTTSGVLSTTVTIADSSYDANPFTFKIQGTGTVPTMSVLGGASDTNAIPNNDTTLLTADGTNFGSVPLSGSVTETFEIMNTGAAPLNLTGTPLIQLSNSTNFSILLQPTSATVSQTPPSNYQTFEVKFTPTALGPLSTTVIIPNNDNTQNPFNFLIEGTGIGPQLAVSGSGHSIANGDLSTSDADGTEFDSVAVGSASATHTFTITNNGLATLNLTGSPLVQLSNTADFSVAVQPASTPLTPSGTSTFQIQFNPFSGGSDTSVVTIDSNDTNNDPYTFTIHGTGIGPQINVQGNSTSIVNGESTPSATDGTNLGSIAVGGGSLTQTFTINNLGTQTLSLTGSPLVQLSDNTDFSVSTLPSASVAAAPGMNSTTFQVKFTPVLGGVLTSTVTIAENDSDENPFHFVIQGTGIGPQIGVSGNGISIAQGDTTPLLTDGTDFGNTTVGEGGVIRTFTIANTGTVALNLASMTPIELSDTTHQFSVVTEPNQLIAAGAATIFQVQFNPTTNGTVSTTVTIPSDDSNENPFVFKIQGTGQAPVMGVQGNGSLVIASGDTTPLDSDGTQFDSVAVGSVSAAHTFTIINSGSSALNLGGSPKIQLSDTTDFSVVALPTSPVAASGSTPFEVEFDPKAGGQDTATVTIVNNDSLHDPYTFTIQGTGLGPGITVTGNGVSIPDGDVSPLTTDDTDFGLAAVGGGSVTETFTIKNPGTSTLNLTGSPLVQLGDTADFSVTQLPSASVAAAGGSTTFQIKFTPVSGGLLKSTVTIGNTVASENPFTFVIQGTGNGPEIDVEGNTYSIPDGTSIPSPITGTDFGSAGVGSTVFHTFTISNTGVLPLQLTSSPLVVLSGDTTSSFSIISSPDLSVDAGSVTTFQVQFNPTTTGTLTATVTIGNNDNDENPYTFTIQGIGTVPVMTVQGNTVPIANGDTTPSAADGTNLGSASVSPPGATTQMFTIQNTGTGPLNLTGLPVISLSDSVDFSVIPPSVSTIPAGGSAAFTIQFNPVNGGLLTSTVTIANNDAGHNPYVFTIDGTGMGPEIDLQGNGTSIVDGDTNPSSADWTDFGGATVGSGGVIRTFTIANTGTQALTLNPSPIPAGTPLVQLTDSTDFSVITMPSASVGPGGTTTFQIRFTPSTDGELSTTVTIDSNDFNESTYTFVIQGAGAVPVMDVQGNSIDIANGDTNPSSNDGTNFGSVRTTTGSVTRTFTILNNGAATLSLTGSPLVQSSDTTDFTVVALPATSVAPSGSTTFQVKFAPTTTGLHTATITIPSDDPAGDPYVFTIDGTGTAPSMSVLGGTLTITDGDTTPSTSDLTDFGTAAASSGSVTHTFTIKNTGTATLNLTASPLVQLTDNTNFTVVTQPAASVAAGGSTTFKVKFAPTHGGLLTATLTIADDDSTKNPYDFKIQGTATAPSMGILGNSISIADGETTPSVADGTDFGGAVASSGSVIHTFTIANTGNQALSLSGSPLVLLSDTTNFSIVTQPAASVAASGSTSFQVKFMPTAAGPFTATITVDSNDTLTSPYVITIQGTGLAPQVGVTGNSVTIANGDMTPSVTDGTDFGSASVAGSSVTETFTIHNPGTAPLNLTGSPLVQLGTPGSFSIFTQPSATVAAGGSTTFQVRFAPITGGLLTSTVAIANNVSGASPFDFVIQGTGIGPQIGVLGNSTPIANGDTTPSATDGTDFGNVLLPVAGGVTRTFTIANGGNQALSLTGSPLVQLSDTTNFSVVLNPSPSVSAGNSTTFQIYFSPTAAGLFSSTVSISSDDASASPYFFTIQGTGVASAIEVQGNSTSIANGDTTASATDGTDFGSTSVSKGVVTHTFVIKNTGNSTLNLSGSPLVQLGNTTDFSVVSLPAATVAPGGTTSFQVQFSPTALGPVQTTVTISSDASNASQYEFTIQGSGIVPPYQNPVNPLDVNHDGHVTAIDALIIINELNANGTHALAPPTGTPTYYFDVNGDNLVSPLDALLVINALNDAVPEAVTFAAAAVGSESPSAAISPSFSQDVIAGLPTAGLQSSTAAVVKSTSTVVNDTALLAAMGQDSSRPASSSSAGAETSAAGKWDHDLEDILDELL